MKLQGPGVIKLAVMIMFCALVSGYVVSPGTSYGDSLARSPQTTNPVQPTEKNTALGLDHFDAHCASCHGSNGKAESDKGKAVRAADLTSDTIQSRSDAELFRVISRGVPGTAMPAFGKSHKPTEIWQTILFLRRLPTLTAEGRKKLESLVPADARHKHPAGKEEQHQHPESAPGTQPNADAGHEHQTPSKPSAKQRQRAQPQSQQHEHNPQTQTPVQQAGPPKPDTSPHDMSKMGKESGGGDAHGAHNMNAMMSTITGGPFRSMSAVGSGTSLMPASAPGYMWHWMKNDWMIMAHGDLKAGFNHQGGPRGVNKAESQNWFMLMAERKAGPGQLMLRGMFSGEPWTAPRRGFPELFQTGETFGGRPIIDAQHPHDLFMELAAAYNIRLSEQIALNFYGGPVGEPALGPVAFMHRMSAAENPAAPLGHHWQDSTHITHGVITVGVTAWRFRVESSVFHGAEPDENRKDIQRGKLDSWSARVWFTPTPDWTMQLSYGHLVDPEALEPGNLRRLTASISHNRSWEDGNWASSLIWGRNHERHGNSNAYLLESTANFLDKNYLYTRLELVDKQGLLQENIFGRPGLNEAHALENGFGIGEHSDQWFRVAAFTFGGVRDILAAAKLRVGIGADVTLYHVPDGLKSVYGSSPSSFHIFLRFRPGKVKH
jgi:mono/diheme cytochrome c family protein